MLGCLRDYDASCCWFGLQCDVLLPALPQSCWTSAAGNTLTLDLFLIQPNDPESHFERDETNMKGAVNEFNDFLTLNKTTYVFFPAFTSLRFTKQYICRSGFHYNTSEIL